MNYTDICSIEKIIADWKDIPEAHKELNERFEGMVNNTPYLRLHRDWVQDNVFGFGERSFHWMWLLLIDEMPNDFNFLEIGVFRGQVISLIRLISNVVGKQPNIYGITPLDSTDGVWESNYEQDLKTIHDKFDLGETYNIIKGLSTDEKIITEANERQYDIVYIDGGHSYDVVKADLANYLPMIKIGGYLVTDDSAKKYKMPFNYFSGIDDVSRVVDEVLPNDSFKELFNVVHNRVFQKIK
jgi:hypothetical protein